MTRINAAGIKSEAKRYCESAFLKPTDVINRSRVAPPVPALMPSYFVFITPEHGKGRHSEDCDTFRFQDASGFRQQLGGVRYVFYYVKQSDNAQRAARQAQLTERTAKDCLNSLSSDRPSPIGDRLDGNDVVRSHASRRDIEPVPAPMSQIDHASLILIRASTTACARWSNQ